MTNISTTTICLFLFVAWCAVCYGSKSEQELIEHILKKSGPTFGRPVKKASKIIDVEARLFIDEIFPEKDNSISMSSLLVMRWRHEFIRWDPEHYGGKTVVAVPANKLWFPDIYPTSDTYDNVADIKRFYEVQDLWVYYNGTVSWAPNLNTRAPCTPDSYLHEKKNCTFQVSSFAHFSSELNLKFMDGFEDADLTQFVENPQIKLLSHSALRFEQIFNQPAVGTSFWSLNYDLIVKLTGKDSSSESSASNEKKNKNKNKKQANKRRPGKRVTSSCPKTSDSS